MDREVSNIRDEAIARNDEIARLCAWLEKIRNTNFNGEHERFLFRAGEYCGCHRCMADRALKGEQP